MEAGQRSSGAPTVQGQRSEGEPSKIRRCVVEWLGVRIVIAWVVLWDLIRWSSCYGMRAA